MFLRLTAALHISHHRTHGVPRFRPWCACLRPGLSSGAFGSLTAASAASMDASSASGHVPSQGWTIRGRVRRLSRRFPRTGPTDRSLQPAHWPGPICTGGWNGLLRTLHERIGRNAGTAGWSRSSTPRSITRTHGCSRTTLRRIASEGATSVIASQRSGTTPRGPNRGSVPQEPVSADILAPRRRHHGPSEDMAWSTMRQLADNEVGVDPADCADAIPSCRARRCISGEHDARAHSGVPFWRRSD